MPRKRAAKKATPIRNVASVRSTRQFVEAEEHIQQPKARVMRSGGNARTSLESEHVIAVDRPVSKEKLEILAFMEEELTILVHDTTDPTAEPLPEIINGGGKNRQYFIRGQEQRVKRKYVEVLARAKRTARGNEKFKDSNGDDAYRYPAHTAPRFPFTVIEDSQKGKEWLKAILSEGSENRAQY